MAGTFLDALKVPNISAPSSPASGYSSFYVDSSQLVPAWKDSSGNTHTMRPDLGGTPCVSDQSLTSSLVFVTGTTATIPPSGIPSGGGIVLRSTVICATSSSTSLTATFVGYFGTNNNIGTDTAYLNSSSVATGSFAAAGSIIKFIGEFSFRSSSSAYWNASYIGTSAGGIGGVGGAVTPTVSTTLTNYWNIAAKVTTTGGNLTVHQAYTEILST